MRAREFVQRDVRENKIVNIPISITIPSDEKAPVVVQQNNVSPNSKDTVEPETSNAVGLTKAEPIVQEPEDQPTMPDDTNGDPVADKMIPPLQQELELEKADAGKDSEVIDQLTQDEDEADEERKTPLAYK